MNWEKAAIGKSAGVEMRNAERSILFNMADKLSPRSGDQLYFCGLFVSFFEAFL